MEGLSVASTLWPQKLGQLNLIWFYRVVHFYFYVPVWLLFNCQ